MVAGYSAQAYAKASERFTEARASQIHDAEQRRRREALDDQYGGRSSLQELENAIKFYEKK